MITEKFVRKEVLPILVSAAFDKSEHPMVRMSAIQMLVYCSAADEAIYQQLAMNTWSESSEEVHSFIWSTLNNLAQLDKPLTVDHFVMKMKSLSVLSLCKPFEGGYGKSQNMFTTGFAEKLTSGFLQQTSWFGSADSTFPMNFYTRSYVQFGSGGMGVNPWEMSLSARTFNKFAYALMEKMQSSAEESEQEKGHPEVQEIRSLLGIKTRDTQGTPQATLFFNMRNEFQRMFELNLDDVERYLACKHIFQKTVFR